VKRVWRLRFSNRCTGYYALGPAANGVLPNFVSGPLAYQTQTVDPAVMLTYAQQLQQPQQTHLHAYQPGAIYQPQLAQLLALRQAQLAQQGQLHTIPSEQVGSITKNESENSCSTTIASYFIGMASNYLQ